MFKTAFTKIIIIMKQIYCHSPVAFAKEEHDNASGGI